MPRRILFKGFFFKTFRGGDNFGDATLYSEPFSKVTWCWYTYTHTCIHTHTNTQIHNLTFGDGVVLGHPAGQHGVLAQPVDLGQGAYSLRGDHHHFDENHENKENHDSDPSTAKTGMTWIFWRRGEVGVDLELLGTVLQSFEGTFCTSKDLVEVRICSCLDISSFWPRRQFFCFFKISFHCKAEDNLED